MPFRERVVLHLAHISFDRNANYSSWSSFLLPPHFFFFFLFLFSPFCDNRIHSKSKVAVCSFGKSTMIRRCLSSRDISSRVYSPLTCCISVTLAPHSSNQTLSRVYNSNSDGPRLPSFRIHDPLIRFIHSRVKKYRTLKMPSVRTFLFSNLLSSSSLSSFPLIILIYQIFHIAFSLSSLRSYSRTPFFLLLPLRAIPKSKNVVNANSQITVPNFRFAMKRTILLVVIDVRII